MTATVAEATYTADQQMPRRIPRPVSEPPYDDEQAGGLPLRRPSRTQGALALDLRRSTLTPSRGVPAARHLSIVEPTAADEDDVFFARQPTSRASLPDPKPFCGRYVQALVEVLAGERPITQLMRWTNDDIYAELKHRVRLVTQATGRIARRNGAVGRARATVRSVHVQEPRDGIAEACVHVRHAGQSRAVALRLEGLDGHWRCTALQFG